MRIGVIGTGVAGSLFAAAAAQAGTTVEAFDRIMPGERDEAGTGLNIGPNALKALRLHGGLAVDGLMAASLPWRRWLIALTDGTPLVDIDMLDVADEPGIRIRWADLYGVLRSASASSTSFGHVLEGVEEDGQGRLVPVFRTPDGLVRHGGFDLLVAADGRYSRLRQLVDGKPVESFPGIGTWRLLVRDAPDSPIHDYGQYFHGNARLLSFRLPGDDIYVAGSFSLGGEGPMPEVMKTAEAQRGFFTPEGRDPSPAVAWMLDQIDAGLSRMNWARTQEIEPLHQARGGRVLLLGDAAHAMFQTLGQGATQAIEDALAAAAVLGEPTPATISDAYEAWRGERVDFARTFTREATDTMLPGADPVAGSLAKAQPPFLDKLRRLYREVV